jgi:hypothetical protein
LEAAGSIPTLGSFSTTGAALPYPHHGSPPSSAAHNRRCQPAGTSFAPRLVDVQNFQVSIKENKLQIYAYKLSHFRLPAGNSHQSAPQIVKINLYSLVFNFIQFTAIATETSAVYLVLDKTDFHEKLTNPLL